MLTGSRAALGAGGWSDRCPACLQAGCPSRPTWLCVLQMRIQMVREAQRPPQDHGYWETPGLCDSSVQALRFPDNMWLKLRPHFMHLQRARWGPPVLWLGSHSIPFLCVCVSPCPCTTDHSPRCLKGIPWAGMAVLPLKAVQPWAAYLTSLIHVISEMKIVPTWQRCVKNKLMV